MNKPKLTFKLDSCKGICYLNKMLKKLRIDASGALYHIIAKGIEKRKIFENNADRDNFLSRIGDILTETKKHIKADCKFEMHQSLNCELMFDN